MGETGEVGSASQGRLIAANLTNIADDRITLPAYLAARLRWLTGKDPVEGWLLLVEEGRYRFLSSEQVEADPQLDAIRAHINGAETNTPNEPALAQEATRAAMVVRLMPVKVSPHGATWRFLIPKLMRKLAPPGYDPNDFTLFFAIDGYLEIWYTEVLRKAASVPLSVK